jgi:hypothetical protein
MNNRRNHHNCNRHDGGHEQKQQQQQQQQQQGALNTTSTNVAGKESFPPTDKRERYSNDTNTRSGAVSGTISNGVSGSDNGNGFINSTVPAPASAMNTNRNKNSSKLKSKTLLMLLSESCNQHKASHVTRSRCKTRHYRHDHYHQHHDTDDYEEEQEEEENYQKCEHELTMLKNIIPRVESAYRLPDQKTSSSASTSKAISTNDIFNLCMFYHSIVMGAFCPFSKQILLQGDEYGNESKSSSN